MKKQSLYVFGGALLATTALATGAQAALIKNGTTVTAGSNAGTAAVTAKGLATQVFGTTGQGAVTVGTTSQSILIDYSSQLTTVFNIQLDVAGAEFTTNTISLTHYVQSNAGATLRSGPSVTGCSTQVLSDKVLISGCDPTAGYTLSGTSLSRVDAVQIQGLSFTSLGALATAGTSVTLSGIIRNSANSITFENITAAAYITSKSAGETSIETGSSVTVDNTASPAFTKLTSSSLTAELGSVHFSGTSAVGTDLSATFTSAVSITSTAEVKITHTVLADDALAQITIAGGSVTFTRTPGQFVSGTVSFQIPGGSLAGAAIKATFTGSAAIDATSGSATVTPTAVTALASAVGSFSGALASLSRGGLSIQLNTILGSKTSGGAYLSFIRLVNSSTLDGTATVTVVNDTTGASIGSYTTDTIKAGGTLTISAADIESKITAITPTDGLNYKVTVAGSFNGYAQHLVFNKTSGVFSDFSGFRNGALTVDP